MDLIPFSKKHKNEFLSRTEDNFNILIKKITEFHSKTKNDDEENCSSRRRIDRRFNYEEELENTKINIKGISTEEAASEFNDLLQGCIRHQDPLTAFNIIPTPLLDVIAGITLISLYNPNPCWDFISGKICLYEKKIVRMLGQLVDWDHADGFVITGGKQALLYAIKNGMGRASLSSPTEMSDYVVICSATAHYSIEHVCHYLGISPENCIRVAADPSGEMNLQAFEKTLDHVISQDKVIAAVLAVGGGTINFFPDSIKEIKQVIDQVTAKRCLSYTPYLHVDTVISWAWLALAKIDSSSWQQSPFPRVTEKISSVLSKLSGIQYADSFAADFHKIGFCPYAAGVFIAKESSNLSGMTLDGSIPKKNLHFGEAEIYRQTLENSRSGLAVASIWIALRRMGLEGLGQFIQYQLEVCETFKLKIKENYKDHFEILNEHSNGWEIVIKPHFKSQICWDQLQKSSANEQELYTSACHQFLNLFWYGDLGSEQQTPVCGFVKSYSRFGSHEQSFPAFLIHPTSLHYDNQEIDKMLEGIVCSKVAFDRQCLNSKAKSTEEYLSQFTPPR